MIPIRYSIKGSLKKMSLLNKKVKILSYCESYNPADIEYNEFII
jgi:hypothetical protein